MFVLTLSIFLKLIYIYSSYKYSSDTTERNVNIIINYFNEKFNVMPEQHTCVEIFKW